MRTVNVVRVYFEGLQIVRGYGGGTAESLPEQLLDENRAHWSAGNQECLPAVYSIAHPKRVFVRLQQENIDLSPYVLIGCAQNGALGIESVQREGDVYCCEIKVFPSVAYLSMAAIEWYLVSESAWHSIGILPPAPLYFIFDVPVGPWQGQPVWSKYWISCFGNVVNRKAQRIQL